MRSRRALFAAVAFLMVATATRAAPSGPFVAPLGAGPLSSSNVELIGTIPDTGATGGRFVANYFITTGSGSFPFVPNANSGLRIYDVSNPEVPVLTGALPLPHTENEDVDVSWTRKLILVSQDNVSTGVGGRLYVIDWSIPQVPRLVGQLAYPASVTSGNRTVGGPGHIANCIFDCGRWATVTGARNGSLFVIDLSNPANPVIAGTITAAQNPAGRPNDTFTTGIIHDVNVDMGGNVWTTGSGGTTMMTFNPSDPLRPTLRYSIPDAVNRANNQFIHHNSLRLDESTVLVTEEDWQQPNCGETGKEQGEFQTWKIPSTQTGNLSKLDGWITELGSVTEGTALFIEFCSSHWFTFNAGKVVAVGWYNQGVRFLDVSNPADIRQVGYFIGPGSMASQAMFVPGRSDLVYVADYVRGIDILRITGGGAGAATVRAPIRAEWITPHVTFPSGYGPDPAFGFACARRVA